MTHQTESLLHRNPYTVLHGGTLYNCTELIYTVLHGGTLYDCTELIYTVVYQSFFSFTLCSAGEQTPGPADARQMLSHSVYFPSILFDFS